jgi:carnitine O-acetyltransferase
MAIRTFTKPSNSLDKEITLPVNIKMAQNGNTVSSSPKDTSPSSPQRFKAGKTFAHQADLPKLPIPDLESSTHRYLDSLRPLQSAKEHHESKIAVREFLKYQGQDLQDKLKKYAEGKSNYIEQFCMYLSFCQQS